MRGEGDRASAAATLTACTPFAYPEADAVMLAVPKLTPVICGCTAAWVWPDATVTVEGEILTFVLSELISVTVTPPCGAAVGRVTANVLV